MKPILIIILALCCLLPTQAQNTAVKDSLLNREMMLEREYSPTVRDAVKINQLPELREPQAPGTTVEFSNYSTPFAVQPKLSPLNPQAFLKDLNYSKYRGYLTAGISSRVDINGDFGYQILNTKEDRLNMFFSHRSSGCNISYLQDELLENDIRRFKLNDNWGGLNYTHDFGDVRFFADAKYTHSAFNYYGLSIPYYIDYLTPEFLTRDRFVAPGLMPNNNFDKNTNQNNQMFEAHSGLASEKAAGLNYKLNVGYTHFGQKYGNKLDEDGSKESRILMDGNIHQMFNSTTGIGISGSIKTFSYANEVFKSLNDSATNYWTYALNPYLSWEDDNMNLVLGAKMDVEVGCRGKITFSPAIRFNYYPSDAFMFYILADGGRKDNSQYNLFYENRYVDPMMRIMDSRSPLDATVGIKFLPLSTLSVDIFGGYKITQDEHFFYPDYGFKNNFDSNTPMLAGNWITPVYNDANTIKLGADLKYAFQDIFELGLKGTYYKWDITTEYTFWPKPQPDASDLTPILFEAWNKPNFEMNLHAAYKVPSFPLHIQLSYTGVYGRKAFDPTLIETIKMKNIHDLSFKLYYPITRNIYLYSSSNNLLFSKYDFWWGYPAQKFSVMEGISILF